MTARTPVEFVNNQNQRVGNQVQVVGAGGVIAAPVVPEAATTVEMYRGTKPETATFSAATTSSFIDKRGFTMVEIGPIPAAMNGRNVTVLSATNAAGAGAVVPDYFTSAGAYAAYVTLAAVGQPALFIPFRPMQPRFIISALAYPVQRLRQIYR